ncbi:unnamed protein product, partial [Aphanomyces euteiches]
LSKWCITIPVKPADKKTKKSKTKKSKTKKAKKAAPKKAASSAMFSFVRYAPYWVNSHQVHKCLAGQPGPMLEVLKA